MEKLNPKQTLLRQYLDGELPADKQQEALHTIADEEELRSMLTFELELSRRFANRPAPDTPGVPEDFSETVMRQVRRRETGSDPVTQSGEEETGGWMEWIWQPRPIAWRPAYTGIAALILMGILLYPLAGEQPGITGIQSDTSAGQSQTDAGLGESIQEISAADQEVLLRFVFIDEDARSVAVAGDFSEWDPVALTRQEVDGKQVWTGLVSMSRGEHRYMFIKDGEQWVTDPLAPMYREDGFGNKNAVIYI